jgi:hypothetical protein
MKAFFIFLSMLFAIQASAQRPEPVSSSGRNQSLVNPSQLQGPPLDTEPPVVVCLGVQNINIHTSGAITVWAADFISSLSDNVTPVNALKIGIRKAGTGTGYPVDAIGNSITSVTFSCSELALQQVEVWAIDEAGNSDYCTAGLQVQDPFSYCDQSYDSVIVCVKYPCNDEPMPGVYYANDGINPWQPPLPIPMQEVTDSTGCGILYVPIGSSATILLGKDDSPLNGVNTADMLLIAKHILGLEPISNPYLLIAADANKSGSITTFDIIELQKLIKGIYTELPNNTSWRFVDASFQFPNPFNPFMTSFPETISFSGSGDLPDSVLFYGIKIGDIDCTASLDSLGLIDAPDANMVITDTLLQSGAVYDMPIYMNEEGPWAGYQFALSFDPEHLSVVGIVPTQYSTASNWSLSPGKMTTSWISPINPVNFGLNEPIAIIKVLALQTIQLSGEFQLDSNVLPAEGYVGFNAEKRDLLLTFEPQFKTPDIPSADKNLPTPDPAQLGDFAPPVITCINGLSVNIMPTGMVNLWSTDFLQAVSDNATPVSAIEIGIRKAGTGIGFPEDAIGLPIQSVLYTCLELGTQGVELWARDLAGNTALCETYVVVTDNLGNCNGVNQDWNVVICAETEYVEGVEEVEYMVVGNNPSGPFYANEVGGLNSGCGHFDVALGSNLTGSVIKDDNPLNGVTTYDKILIAKHIDGTEPLNSPYKIIAADADKNGIIDSMDILELEKLILGINTEFPNNTSWRFVPKDFVFPDPANPFITPFPESSSIQNLQFPVTLEFVAIKVGDVNNSAVANFSGSSSDERRLANQSALIGIAYPNPTHAGAVIPMEIHSNAWVSYSVYSMQGRQVWMNESELPPGIHSLDIPAEAFVHPGMYLWLVRAGDTVKTGKIVAE